VKLDASGNRDSAFAGNVLSANTGDAVFSISESSFYVCGKFSTPRNSIAALDPSTGALVSAFNPTGPGTGSVLYDVLYNGSRIFTVGDFTAFNGSARRGIAALNNAGNLDVSWPASAAADNTARSVIQLPAIADLLTAGDFTSYGGTSGLNGTARMSNSNGTFTSGYTSDNGLSVNYIYKVRNP